jgi:hypothetical protein
VLGLQEISDGFWGGEGFIDLPSDDPVSDGQDDAFEGERTAFKALNGGVLDIKVHSHILSYVVVKGKVQTPVD